MIIGYILHLVVIILEDNPKYNTWPMLKLNPTPKTHRKKARLLLPFVHFRTYIQSEEFANYNLWIKKTKHGPHIPYLLHY